MSVLKAPVTSRDHIIGPAYAPVTVVEYGDYQCPYCAMAHPNVKQLLRLRGDDVRLIFRHFPLTEVHPLALPAAETAEFAGAYGQFWPMHDAIYSNSTELSLPLLMVLCAGLGLDSDKLQEALALGTYRPAIQAYFIGGVHSGVNGTPCFFVNGVRHDGGYDLAELVAAVDAAHAAVTEAPNGRRSAQA